MFANGKKSGIINTIFNKGIKGNAMAYINNLEINEIRSRANIVDIIGEYLTIQPKGKNYVALCPFHSDHSPSLIISPEKQIFNCFTCRTGGNVFSFIMKYENVSFYEALKIVASKIGYNLNIKDEYKTSDKYSKYYEIYEYASKYYINNINTTEGIKAREYLNKRGISDDVIKEFKIGVSLSNKSEFYKIASNRGWSIELLDKLGLINRIDDNIYDTFINRIVIPIEDLRGSIVGFTGRIYNGEENSAKYLNTKETEIFKKGSLLFNYHNAKKYIRDKKCVIVVEGNMDAIKLSSKGIKNVLALQGVALSNEQIDILKRLNVPVILMLDSDEAGESATVKNGDLLKLKQIDVRVVRLSGAKDPDEYLEKYSISDMENNIDKAMKYIDFKMEYLKSNKNLSNMEDLIAYVKDVISNINSEDDLTKEIILSKISNDYKIDIDILKSNIKSPKKIVEKSNDGNIKISKYHRASHKVLYYMLMDNKYINMYKNTLGFLKERMERILASEIIHYAKEKDIVVADFLTSLMEEEEEYQFLQIIISENGNTTVSDEEFISCVKAIKDIIKSEKIKELKEEIIKELDQSKKEKLIEKLISLKKEV